MSSGMGMGMYKGKKPRMSKEWNRLLNGYESKSWINKRGNTGFMTRPAGQKTDYPHDTEWRKDGRVFDRHTSYSPGQQNRNVHVNKAFWVQNDPKFGSKKR